jgi:hypothetical protein
MWKIYYSDHTEENDTSVSSEQLVPFAIKRRADVQVIVQSSSDHRWKTLSGKDYYTWDIRGGDAEWFGEDIFGLHNYLLKPGYKCVLFGVVINSARFNEIFNLARKEWGNKEAFARTERHP